MKSDLFICFQRGFIKAQNIPLTDDIVLFDTLDLEKRTKFYNCSEWRKLDYINVAFPPQEAKYQFPQWLYLVFKKKQKEFSFNYLEYGSDVKILSEDLYQTLCDKGLSKEQYEYAELKLSDKNGNLLSEKKYCALRFGKFDDELFDFNKQTVVRTKVNGSTNYLYPDLKLSKTSQKKIFVLKEFCFRNSFLIEGTELATQLSEKFIDLDIYHIADFPFVYNNQYDDNELPQNNKFKI